MAQNKDKIEYEAVDNEEVDVAIIVLTDEIRKLTAAVWSLTKQMITRTKNPY